MAFFVLYDNLKHYDNHRTIPDKKYIHRLLTKCEVKMQDGWILGKFFFHVFIYQEGEKVHRHAKRPISRHLTHSCSQSHCRIQFILPAHRASQIIISNVLLALIVHNKIQSMFKILNNTELHC